MSVKMVRLLTSAALMASGTYITLYADSLSLTDFQIGTIVSIYSFILFLSSYLFGRASDIRGRRKIILLGVLLLSIAMLIQIFAYDFTSLLLIRFFVGLSAGIFPAALTAYVYEKREKIGKFISFNALGWVLGLLVSGIIALYCSIKHTFLFSAFSCFAAFLFALKLKEVKTKPINVPLLPVEVFVKNVHVYLPYFLRHVGANMIWTFWPLYLQELGADLFWVSGVQIVNPLTQFAVMFLITDMVNPSVLFAGGILLSSITFFSFTLAENFWQLIPALVVLGCSWSLMYVGALRELIENNEERATVSGLLDSLISLAAVIGPALATAIINFFDFKFCMYLASTLAFTGFLMREILRRRIR